MSRLVFFATHTRVFSVKVRLPNGEKVTWDDITIACPGCGSTYIVCNGKPKQNKGHVQGLRCEACGKQFKFHTCPSFVAKLQAMLKDACEEAITGGAKQHTLAQKWGVSDATMSKVVRSLKGMLAKTNRVVALLDAKVTTTLISMDEAVVTIGGKKMWLILARNGDGKTLAFALSKSRSKVALRAVFDQAEALMEHPTEILLTDGLKAYQGVARDLNRPMIHAIHIHKPPYTRLVVRRISYDADKTHREELTFATKTDILVRRGKREIRYVVTNKYVGPPRKRGRKKGQKKARQSKRSLRASNKAPRSKKKKRGPKYGLGTLHTRGKKAYVKVDPYRRTVKGSGLVPPEVVTAVQALQAQFGQKHVVNNISEWGISQFRRGVPLTGPQTTDGIEAGSSVFFRVKNGSPLEVPPELARHFSPKLALKGIFSPVFFQSSVIQPEFEMHLKEEA